MADTSQTTRKPARLPAPDLVVWCRENPWAAAAEIEWLRNDKTAKRQSTDAQSRRKLERQYGIPKGELG